MHEGHAADGRRNREVVCDADLRKIVRNSQIYATYDCTAVLPIGNCILQMNHKMILVKSVLLCTAHCIVTCIQLIQLYVHTATYIFDFNYRKYGILYKVNNRQYAYLYGFSLYSIRRVTGFAQFR